MNPAFTGFTPPDNDANMIRNTILSGLQVTLLRSEVRSRRSERHSYLLIPSSYLAYGTMLIIFILSFIPKNSEAQATREIKLSDFSTWDLGMSTGVTFPRTDINGKAKFGIGFDFTKFLSQHFAMQARFVHATLAGDEFDDAEYQYRSTINYDLSLNAKFQTNRLIILPHDLQKRLALYATIGIGLVHYSPEISIDGGHVKLHGIYSQYGQTYDTVDYRGSTDFVLPVSVGAAYRLSDKISLNAEFSFRPTNSDRLDGYFKLLSSNDSWSYLSAGIIIHLGKESKVLQWTDIDRQEVKDNKELNALRIKVNQYNNDADGDGVADPYDKEPATPQGAKVYGDGTSIDTDNDGVPDYSDDEPFSAKNAKVDSKGKDVRVPVVQPQTPPQSQMNTQTPAQSAVNTPVLTKAEFPVIYFDYDKTVIRREYNQKAGEIATRILSERNKRYRLIGICDKPSSEYNVNLALRRAEAVKKHLVKYYNIDPNVLKTEVEFVKNDASAPEKSRRVEVRIIEN
jgi:outer membrane protein OmpA-like peptidoglycan-associated protein/opacity protein-like surface antigen